MKSNKVKEQKIKRTKNNEFLIFDPVSQKLLDGKLKVNIQYILIKIWKIFIRNNLSFRIDAFKRIHNRNVRKNMLKFKFI